MVDCGYPEPWKAQLQIRGSTVLGSSRIKHLTHFLTLMERRVLKNMGQSDLEKDGEEATHQTALSNSYAY